MPATVDILVLNWNGLQLTEDCLTALEKQSYPFFKVLVVDNGSTDESVAALSLRRSATFNLLQLPANRGFAGGMNVGLRVLQNSNADYVWLLNNDAFPEPDCLEKLLRFMDGSPNVGICTPRLLSADGSEQRAGGHVCWATGENTPLRSDDLAEPSQKCYWLTGTALLVRRKALCRVGLLDPNYFAYWEDVDLCVRFRNAQYDMRAVPEAVCFHLGGSSTGGSSSLFARYMSTRNGLYFLKKHLPIRSVAAAWSGYVSKWLERIGILLLKDNRPHGIAILQGLYAGLLGEKGKPTRFLSPVPFERFLIKHPWRIQRVMYTCHRLLTALNR